LAGWAAITPAPAMKGFKSSFTYAAAARRLAEEGRRVINLTIGQPPEEPPGVLLEAVNRAVSRGYNKYSPSRGLGELRRAIAELERERLGVDVDPDNIVVTPGAKPALMLAMLMARRRPGRLLILDPYFYAYVNQARLFGIEFETLPLMVAGGVYEFDVEGIVSRIESGRYSAVLLNTPHNPAGTLLSQGEMHEIVEAARRRKVLVISDEVYIDFTYEGEPASLLKEGYGIYINSFSKSLFITGWRIGYLIADRETAELAASLAANTYTCAPTPLQAAVAEHLVEAYHEAVKRIRELYPRRASLLNDAFSHIPGVEMLRVRAGMFGFPLLDTEIAQAVGGVEEYARRLLEEKGVAVIPGHVFSDAYADRGFRVSLAASPEEIREAARLITEFNEELLAERRR